MSRCPHCNNPLTMEERRMRNCPACGKPLASGGGGDPVMMEVAGPTSRREAYWDKPTPSSYQAPGWGSVRTAVTLTAMGWLFIQLFVLILQIIRANPPQGPAVGLAVLLRVLDYAVIVGAVFYFTGVYASCLAPGDSLAKIFGIIISLVVSVGIVIFIILIVGEVSSVQALRARVGGDKAEPWKPETFKALGYVLVISIFVGMVLFTFFQWAVALKLRQTALSVCILVFLVLQVAGVVSLFVMALKQEGFMNPGPQPSRAYLATPVQMLLFPKEKKWAEWLIVGTSTFLCLWFLVQSLMLRHAAKRAMTRE